MRKYLKIVEDSLNGSMFSIEQMIRNKHKPDVLFAQQIMLAELYIQSQDLGNIIYRLNLIAEECVSEIKGTYYKDHIEPMLDDGFYDFDEYNVYATIIRMIEGDGLKLSEELKDYISKFANLESKLTNGLYDLIPNLPVVNVSDTGESYVMTKEEHIQGEQIKNRKVQAPLLICYDTMLIKLKKLAREKGNLAEIIRLTE